jgi:hypothetical protein
MKSNSFRPATKSQGFTLVELAAIIAICTLIGLTLVPALARTRPTSKALQCLNNARRLAVVFSMDTAEYTEFYPPNPDDGTTQPGYNWFGGDSGIGQAEEFNTDLGTAVPNFIDYPATCHDHGCSFSFCDGRAEIHHWKGTAIDYGGQYPIGQHKATATLDLTDWTWLANATTQDQ